MLSGEFRRPPKGGHRNWLSRRGDGVGEPEGEWDPENAIQEASWVDFSDWPLAKPWDLRNQKQFESMAPECEETPDGEEDCRARKIWMGLYDDFRERREVS